MANNIGGGNYRFQFEWYTDAAGSSSNVYADSFGNLSTSTWYFVVAYHDASKAAIGIRTCNGSAIDTTAASGGNDGSGAFAVGGVSGNYFNGAVDEARIYNRALSPAEIQSLYTSAPAPVAYYKMEESSGARYDSSGNENNLTDNATVTQAIGKFGSAGQFTSANSEYLSSSSTQLDNTHSGGSFTYTAWVYMDAKASDAQAFMSQMGDTGNWSANLSYTGTSTDRFRFLVSSDGGAGGLTTLDADTLGSPSANNWYFVAAWYDEDNTDIGISINGGSADTTNHSGGVYDSSADFEVGRRGSTGALEYTNGRIDEARIYNYARTQEQIISDMNAGHPAPGSPVGSPILNLKFDEGYGDAANDSSPQGNNGNLGGATSCPQSGDSACPTWTNSGKFGKALDFETSGTTDDYVRVADDPSLNFSNNFSVSYWINIEDTTTYSESLTKMRPDSGAADRRNYIFFHNDVNPGEIGISLYDGTS